MAKRTSISFLALTGFLVMATGTNQDLMDKVSGGEGDDEHVLAEPPPPPVEVEPVEAVEPVEVVETVDSPPPIEGTEEGSTEEEPNANGRCCCVNGGQGFGKLVPVGRCAGTCSEDYNTQRPVMGGRCRPKN